MSLWHKHPGVRSGDDLSLGERAADTMRNSMGSWPFVFGALVFLFQQGHLSHLLNFTPNPLDPSVPVLLFCLVFGLSMDYEVLLISRIQEEYRKTGDTRHAVAEGMERSGRLITGAAAIMVAVFAAFGLADVVLIKALGLGLAIAVTMDATLVRALVVPAVMRLLGNAPGGSRSRRRRRVTRGITLRFGEGDP